MPSSSDLGSDFEGYPDDSKMITASAQAKSNLVGLEEGSLFGRDAIAQGVWAPVGYVAYESTGGWGAVTTLAEFEQNRAEWKSATS